MASLVSDKHKPSNLSVYTLAVGTGLGLSSAVEAEIIYTDVADLIASDWGNGGESFTIDLNNDGVSDFTFSHQFSPQGYGYVPGYSYSGPYGYYYSYGYGYPIPHSGFSKVTGSTFFSPFGRENGAMYGPLAEGAHIGQGETFSASQTLGEVYYYSDFGPWPAGTRGYIGLQFAYGPMLHYGWAQIEVGAYSGDVILFDFAYESNPFASIAAGAMPSPVPVPAVAPLLGAALGAMGVAGFRRRRREAEAQAAH